MYIKEDGNSQYFCKHENKEIVKISEGKIDMAELIVGSNEEKISDIIRA